MLKFSAPTKCQFHKLQVVRQSNCHLSVFTVHLEHLIFRVGSTESSFVNGDLTSRWFIFIFLAFSLSQNDKINHLNEDVFESAVNFLKKGGYSYSLFFSAINRGHFA